MLEQNSCRWTSNAVYNSCSKGQRGLSIGARHLPVKSVGPRVGAVVGAFVLHCTSKGGSHAPLALHVSTASVVAACPERVPPSSQRNDPHEDWYLAFRQPCDACPCARTTSGHVIAEHDACPVIVLLTWHKSCALALGLYPVSHLSAHGVPLTHVDTTPCFTLRRLHGTAAHTPLPTNSPVLLHAMKPFGA